MPLVSSDYYILYVLFIAIRYFVFYFTLYNAGPLSHILTYLLIHCGILFIMNKLEDRAINRDAWLNKINAVSLRKLFEDYNGVLNYYTRIIIYTVIISKCDAGTLYNYTYGNLVRHKRSTAKVEFKGRYGYTNCGGGGDFAWKIINTCLING